MVLLGTIEMFFWEPKMVLLRHHCKTPIGTFIYKSVNTVAPKSIWSLTALDTKLSTCNQKILDISHFSEYFTISDCHKVPVYRLLL